MQWFNIKHRIIYKIRFYFIEYLKVCNWIYYCESRPLFDGIKSLCATLGYTGLTIDGTFYSLLYNSERTVQVGVIEVQVQSCRRWHRKCIVVRSIGLANTYWILQYEVAIWFTSIKSRRVMCFPVTSLYSRYWSIYGSRIQRIVKNVDRPSMWSSLGWVFAGHLVDDVNTILCCIIIMYSFRNFLWFITNSYSSMQCTQHKDIFWRLALLNYECRHVIF